MQHIKEIVKKYWKPVLKSIAFVAIFLVLFSYVQDIFELKGQGYGKYRCFNWEEPNSINVIFFGNSRTNRGVNPVVVDEVAGTHSFNYGLQGLRANQVYYRVLDAFKTQSPKLIVLESSICVSASASLEESYAHRALVSLPTSISKIEAALDLGEDDQMKAELIMPLLRFHTRFREIEAVDFRYIMDLNPEYPYSNQPAEEVMETSRGYTPYETDLALEDDGKGFFDKDYASITKVKAPDEKLEYYFKKIVEFAEEHGAKVLILSIPSMDKKETPKEIIPLTNYLRQLYADDENVAFLDATTDMKSYGLGYDCYHNVGHLNRQGAKKLSGYIGQFLKENYSYIID